MFLASIQDRNERYQAGREAGYKVGHDEGYKQGYEAALREVGTTLKQAWVGYEDMYNEARASGKTVGIKLTDALHSRVTELAKFHGVTIKRVVFEAVARFVEGT